MMQGQFISVHPDNPQPRFIAKISAILQQGGLGVVPTDSAYALCCCLENKAAMERMVRIRAISRTHNFTLLCRDLSELSAYARCDDPTYRLLRHHTPGPYTFILPATKEVPRRLMNEKRRTIGIRVPHHAILAALLDALDEPLMSCTLILPGETLPENDPVEIFAKLSRQVDVVVDGGVLVHAPTTVIRFEESGPVVRRRGAGDPTPFEA